MSLRSRAPRVLVRGLLIPVTLLAAVGVPANAGPAAGQKLYFEACPGFSTDHVWDHYHDYAEVTEFLRGAVAAHPERVRLDSMGRSFLGRELWVATLTDPDGGEAGSKPAVWVDGGIDADEVIAVEVALHTIWTLLTDEGDRVAELMRRRTFYVAPAVIPDTSDLHMTTPLRPDDTTMRPWDDDGDGRADEDPPEDLDGDGQALRMRRQDPHGDRVAHEEDPRVLRPRRLGDRGPFYRVWSEGVDSDGDGEINEDGPGGIDPNRNYPGRWTTVDVQRGAGPWPASEIEIRAMLDFFRAHPDIAASQHLHSSGGVILMPPSVPGMELPADDLALYLELAREGLEVTGYDLATNVYDWNWPPGARNDRRGQVWRDDEGEIRGGTSDYSVPVTSRHAAYPAYGGSLDTLYELFGTVSFANEIFPLGQDDDGDGTVSEVERLRADDALQDGAGFKEWERFEHPDLGVVEIGGWRKFGQNNPLPSERYRRELRGNTGFILLQAEAAQELAVAAVDVVDLGDAVYRVTVRVENRGRVPTELQVRRRQGTAEPVRVSAALPAGARFLSPDSETQAIEVVSGYGVESVQWVVHAPDGGRLSVQARHPKAGAATGSAVLPGRR